MIGGAWQLLVFLSAWSLVGITADISDLIHDNKESRLVIDKSGLHIIMDIDSKWTLNQLKKFTKAISQLRSIISGKSYQEALSLPEPQELEIAILKNNLPH